MSRYPDRNSATAKELHYHRSELRNKKEDEDNIKDIRIARRDSGEAGRYHGKSEDEYQEEAEEMRRHKNDYEKCMREARGGKDEDICKRNYPDGITLLTRGSEAVFGTANQQAQKTKMDECLEDAYSQEDGKENGKIKKDIWIEDCFNDHDLSPLQKLHYRSKDYGYKTGNFVKDCANNLYGTCKKNIKNLIGFTGGRTKYKRRRVKHKTKRKRRMTRRKRKKTKRKGKKRKHKKHKTRRKR